MNVEQIGSFEVACDGLEGLTKRCAILCALLSKLSAGDLASIEDACWVRRLRVALDEAWDATEDGERKVLRCLAPERRRSRPRAAVGSLSPVRLHRDPSTVVGAIRLVLAQHPQGRHISELRSEVGAVRPGTGDATISSVLSTMVHRREVMREGYHKQYRYTLVGLEQARDDADDRDITNATGAGGEENVDP